MIEEITSFNELFSVAKERDAYLDSFYQDATGAFKASWRAGPRIPGSRGPHVERVPPFNAARDALLALLNDAEPGEAAPPAAVSKLSLSQVEDLFG